MNNELKEIFIVEGHYTENSPAPLFGDCLGYGKEEVDALLARKDKEIARLKDKCQMHDFFWEGCGFDKLGFKNSIDVREAFDRCEAQNERLLQALNEAVQAQGFKNLNIPESLARLMGEAADAKGEAHRKQHEIAELQRKLAEKSEKILELQKASDVALSKVYTLLDEIKSLKASCPGLPPVGMPQPQRWMTATNPPQNMREVLICVPIRGHLAVCLGHYNYSRKQWFLHDKYDPTEVAYWSEKPMPPEKG